MRVALRWTAIVAALAVAVVLVLFAHDLRAWRTAFTRGDLRAQAGLPATWEPSTVLPSSWSENALGYRSDRQLRVAIRRFNQTYVTVPGFDSGLSAVEARDAAEAALGTSGTDADPRSASQALNLLALLLFGDSSAGGGTAAAIRAVDDLDQAVVLDPGNTEAKANLELVLRLLETHGTRVGPSTGAGPHSSGHRGAGTGVPGQGY